MINISSEIPKFNFFNEIIYEDNSKNENQDKNINNVKKSAINEIKNDYTININNISISGPKEIFAINSMLFINGKLIHEQDGKMIRENLIMKIYENEILDLYRVFNGVYYGFRYLIFKNKPYFIIIGGNFDEYTINNNLELFMLTSIKIYDATHFTNNELKKLPPQNIMNPKEEPYPQILTKNIKILKRISDQKIICTDEDISLEEYESVQNINSFSINNEFTYAAISLDQGDILLLSAFPNFIDCETNSIKVIYLPKISFREKGHITNLFFTKINIYYNIKNILYASTSKIIYFYEWENKTDGEESIKLKTLNNGPGSYNGCIDVIGKNFIMCSSNDDFIYEYENLEMRKNLPFKGKKTNILYFKEYIAIAMGDDNSSFLQVYDKKFGIFVYFKQKKEKIIGLCCEDNNLYIIYEQSKDFKYIIKLREMDTKLKMAKIINKKLFSLALSYTEKYKLDAKNIANILILYADDEFNKGKYKESIHLYTKTIGYLEPNKIVFKFKEKSKLEYLITYLEKYLDNLEFKFNIHCEEYYNYTKLLLNCYILANKFNILKEYINKKEIYFSVEIIEYITEIYFETNNIDEALKLSKKNERHINYIKILLKLNKKGEALEFIKSLIKEINNNDINISNNNQNELSNQIKCEKIQAVFKNFIPFFIIEDDWSESNKEFEKQYFELLTNFVETNYFYLEEKDIINLFYEFLYLDNYFEILFDKLSKYPIFFDEKIYQRRIELYLNKGKEENKEKILSLLSNSIYKSIYDFDSLLFLFESYNFIEGIESISKQRNSFENLFFILFNNKDYKKVLEIFINNNIKEKSLWLLALQLFLSELKITANNEEKEFFFKNALSLFLFKLIENEIFPPIYILEVIKEINCDIPLFLVQSFYMKAIEKENNNFVSALVKNKDFDAISQDINYVINTLKMKPIDIKLEKCELCNLKINNPCIIFRCRHIYHSSCLNESEKKNHCPKCIIEKEKMQEKLNKSNQLYKNLNNFEKLENEINTKEDAIKYLDELYGEGILQINLNNSIK